MGIFSGLLDKLRGHLDRFMLFKGAYEASADNKPFPATKEDRIELAEKSKLAMLGEAYVSLDKGQNVLGEMARTGGPLFGYEVKSRTRLIGELNEGYEWRREIKEDNFAKHLEATLNDYDRKVWKDSVLYDRGRVYRPGITEKDVKRTIAEYYNKLIHSTGFDLEKHKDLLIRARSYFPGQSGKQKVA